MQNLENYLIRYLYNELHPGIIEFFYFELWNLFLNFSMSFLFAWVTWGSLLVVQIMGHDNRLSPHFRSTERVIAPPADFS